MKHATPSMQILLGLMFGMGIGAAAALVLGSGGLWLAIGLAIGIAMGATMSRKNKEAAPANQRPIVQGQQPNDARLTMSLK
ncbi:MAG TPA: hypothetical protein VFY05_13040 [Candidatus Angelobacter sp.]|nr:hypothetical protein [Candidatus Angelobacter sp.]